MRRSVSRRRFLGQLSRAGAGLSAAVLAARAQPAFAQSATLAARFPDLRRHFVFEYYPWYGGGPLYGHRGYLQRRPPAGRATHYGPGPGPRHAPPRAGAAEGARRVPHCRGRGRAAGGFVAL